MPARRWPAAAGRQSWPRSASYKWPLNDYPLHIAGVAVMTAAILPLVLGFYVPLFCSQLVYPEYGNLYIRVAAVAFLLSGLRSNVQERSGINMKYSKFATDVKGSRVHLQVPSRLGMFLSYFPAAVLAGAYFYTAVTGVDVEGSLGLPFTVGLNGGESSLRFIVLTGLMTAHFFKRTLETLFLHSYSGSMDAVTLGFITTSYFVLTQSTLWLQKLVEGVSAPSINLMWPGVAVSLVGLAGNLYHHYLLSTLRSSMDSQGVKQYSIPRGGLFEYVACGHYFFEILSFIGYASVSQTIMGISGAALSALYLSARSKSTLDWYQQRIENFPKDRKALIPFLY